MYFCLKVLKPALVGKDTLKASPESAFQAQYMHHDFVLSSNVEFCFCNDGTYNSWLNNLECDNCIHRTII